MVFRPKVRVECVCCGQEFPDEPVVSQNGMLILLVTCHLCYDNSLPFTDQCGYFKEHSTGVYRLRQGDGAYLASDVIAGMHLLNQQ